jgi:hypothetical protein
MPNTRLASLTSGRHTYTNRIDGKDFVVYEIRQADGPQGYIIGDQGAHECRP